MLKIQIVDIINSKNAITHSFGLQVFEQVLPLLKNGVSVILSFAGLRNVTSGFVNASVGKLYLEIGNASDLLVFEGLDEKEIWKEKVNSAILLASNPEKISIQNNAISELLYS